MLRLIHHLTNAVPLWVLAGRALALWHPPWVTWFTGEWITWGLAVIMLGMQTSGLGPVLARTCFVDPLTALPCAISATVHSVRGSLLAGWWRWRESAAIAPGLSLSGSGSADRLHQP